MFISDETYFSTRIVIVLLPQDVPINFLVTVNKRKHMTWHGPLASRITIEGITFTQTLLVCQMKSVRQWSHASWVTMNKALAKHFHQSVAKQGIERKKETLLQRLLCYTQTQKEVSGKISFIYIKRICLIDKYFIRREHQRVRVNSKVAFKTLLNVFDGVFCINS